MGRKTIDLKLLQVYVDKHVKKWRNIRTTVRTRRFQETWEVSTDVQKQVAWFFIMILDNKGLKKWLKNHPSLDLGDLPITVLKKIAKRQKVPGYSRMTKGELVFAITEE